MTTKRPTLQVPLGYRLVLLICILFLIVSVTMVRDVRNVLLSSSHNNRIQEYPTRAVWIKNSTTTTATVDPSDPSSFHWEYPVADSSSMSSSINNKRAIVLLSMGQDAANSFLLERSLLSIRKRGQFMGPIMVLTDAPLKRFQNLQQHDPMLFIIQPPEQDWKWNFKKDMPYKRFKTYAIDYVPSELHVDFLYYLDLDVLVGQPLEPWFEHVESNYFSNLSRSSNTTTTSSSSSTIAFFQGNYPKNFPIQGGQYIVSTKSSNTCLRRWRYHIDQHPETPFDQHALKRLRQDKDRCHLEIMPQDPFLTFHVRDIMESNKTKPFRTLMHLKNHGDGLRIPDETQKAFFIDLLQLSPYEAQVIGKTSIDPNMDWTKTQLQFFKTNPAKL